MTDESHNERKRPFVIDREVVTGSTDEIEARYDPEWSAMRSGRAERQVFAYVAVNATKGNRYSCEIFENDNGELCCFCNCLSRVPCKHLASCLKDYRERKEIADRQTNLQA